jgi:hypothetical protein
VLKEDVQVDIRDLAIFEPEPSDWFSLNIEYKGIGRAEFENPGGTLTGDAYATFNEYGEYAVILEVNEAIFPDGKAHSYFEFLSIGDLGKSKCVGLVIETDNGTLTVEEIGHFGYNLSGNLQEPDGFKLKLTFHFTKAVFYTGANVRPKYWVMPLSNFLSDFYESRPRLSNHPLRLIPTPKLTDDISPEKKDIARGIANKKNHLIVFDFNDDYGFVEALDDYEDRKDKLNSGRVRNLLTAIMVANLSGLPSDSWEELQEWFPIDFLYLLGIATGSEVGSNTIEVRGENATLIRRFHTRLGTPTYLRGHRAIDEVLHTGTGLLLSNAISSDDWGKSYTRVLLRYIVRGGFHEQSMLEDRFLYLCRGIETLAKCLHFDAEYLLESLSPRPKEAVNTFIQNAYLKIMEVANNRDLTANEQSALERIGNRIRSSGQKDESFGWKVYKLLEHFHLPDARVMDKHFQEHPRLDNKATWGNVLSYYRGSAVHEGYFDRVSNRPDRLEILSVINHLHDILLRIAFLMLGYDGDYDPSVLKDYRYSKPVNWVTSDTSGKDLGY